jgi:regulator of replication initiation timing
MDDQEQHTKDCDVEEAYAAVMELRLQLLMLENERNALKSENQDLRKNLQELMMKECNSTARRREISEEAKKKWQFYHDNKATVYEKEGFTNWRDVKRETDRLFYERGQTESQRT